MSGAVRAARVFPEPRRSFPWLSRRFVTESGLRLDFLCVGLLSILTAAMLLPGALTLPLELWDESRNAVNALEMVTGGDWIVTRFAGQPDLWNTKPPLLTWIVAALLGVGLEPVVAIRLPAILATMGSVTLIYVACRTMARDRLAGLFGGLFAIASVLFMGDHAGRTGDFDALLTCFNLGFVLSVGRYIDADRDRSGRWIAVAAALLVLAVMTKGVAGGLAVPGLLAYAIARRRVMAVLSDWRLWLSVFGAGAVLAVWFAAREHSGPGYLAAMWANDMGGRMATALDDHVEGPFYYLQILAVSVQPAILLSPALFLVWRDPDPARRRLCLLMLLTVASWLLLLTTARTKLYWYVVPTVPLLAIAVGVATTTLLRRSGTAMKSGTILRPLGFALLLIFWYQNIREPREESPYAPDQVWYGPFLNDLRGHARLDGAAIVDGGLANGAGFANYNPVALFYTQDAARRGEHIRLAVAGTRFEPGTTVVTCDPIERLRLRASPLFVAIHENSRCLAGYDRPSPMVR